VYAAGVLSLDGHHAVLLEGARPGTGDAFVIGEWISGRSGTFASVTDSAAHGIDYLHVYDDTAKEVRLVADTVYLEGDANRDGTVDFSDFLILQTQFGAGGVFGDGDFNLDGTVDFSDFLLLQTNFGFAASGPVAVSSEQLAALDAFAAANVPEPTGLAALGLGMGLIAVRRRQK